MSGTGVRRAVVLGLWFGGSLALGLLAVLPLGFGVTAAVRLGDLAAHHAGTEVLGTTSPYPVDDDEVAVSLVFGILGTGILLGPLLALTMLLRRTLPPGGSATAKALAATLALSLAPSIWLWLALDH